MWTVIFFQIPVVADLPVGYNLQDHIYPGGMHVLINSSDSIIQPRIINLKDINNFILLGRGEQSIDLQAFSFTFFFPISAFCRVFVQPGDYKIITPVFGGICS